MESKEQTEQKAGLKYKQNEIENKKKTKKE